MTFSFVFIALVTAEFVYAKSVSSTLAGDRGYVYQRTGEHSAGADCRTATCTAFEAKENGTSDPLLAVSEAGRQDRDRVRRLRDLRVGGILQDGQRSGLQELRERRFNPQSVGMAGGCNPVPLKATQTADAIIIQEADIAAGGRMFAQQ